MAFSTKLLNTLTKIALMTSLPKGMGHIDRRELLTSLPARIQYLHDFLEFGPDDVEALITGQKYIKTIIPAIVNMVYKKLLKHDITARVFSTRDSRSSIDPEIWMTENSTSIEHRKMFLRWYLTKLNSDCTKFEYWEYLDKVGLMHVGAGRKNPLHVDYIFLGVCLGYIQDAFMEAILSHPKLDLRRKIAIVKAVNKVIWTQNDLLAKWHVSDASQYLDEDDVTLDDRGEEGEGYLHGKKILGTGEGSDTSSVSSGKTHTSLGRSLEDLRKELDDVVPPLPGQKDGGSPFGGRCPFSGVAAPTAVGDQRAEMTRPCLKTALDETKLPRPILSGAPRLHLVDGKVKGRENLDPNPFGSGESIGQAL
ncbi:hypothetical protein HII31_03649 [Pseudocercospora fuligena]|uniref:Globin-sensor domain-containing protein n=1 Tax=Pseudocercospora fuligena TaxID=685502 RepID=A0A8H6VQA6_9PEZI|nr:hypothetical protein HII31_03649 [Pseudocercospora fuligena]